jgi:hypothetical protein
VTDTNTEHTPAPWAYEEETGRIYFADGDVEPTIAFVEIDNTSPERARADGHLLAASPKLLKAVSAALERMADIYRDTFDSRMDHDPLGIQLRDALAAARPPAGVQAEPAPPPAAKA